MVQGADTVIYERLANNNPVNNSMKGVTREHMEQYGAAGLRTLCLAYCELDKADYDAYVSVTATPPGILACCEQDIAELDACVSVIATPPGMDNSGLPKAMRCD